VDKQ
jgi:hypothetical protein